MAGRGDSPGCFYLRLRPNPLLWKGIVQATEIIICVPPPVGRGNTKHSSERILPYGKNPLTNPGACSIIKPGKGSG